MGGLVSEPIDVSLILPSRNEAANILTSIQRAKDVLSGFRFEIIVVDDNSPDGTSAIVRDLAATDRSVRIMERVGRRGLASACIEGAMAASGKVIAVMDADLQHDEAVLPKLVSAVLHDDYELAVGTRYVAEGGTGDWQDDRKAKSALATRLAHMVLKT